VENVFEHLKFAEVYQTEKLKSACAEIIGNNLGDLKRGPEWTELKKDYPELAFYIVEKFF
jgi:hypothetical protein